VRVSPDDRIAGGASAQRQVHQTTSQAGQVKDGLLTHAGGVVHRNDRGNVMVLLVRARREPHDWVLPKGHIEAGETPAQAAQREVSEEAGVDASPTDYLGALTFRSRNGELVHVGVYLMRFVRDVPAQEDREVRWCSFREAAELVAFENTRQMLEVAERLIRP
jgi:8-oxo-dGTP pyrophosphatase MutT (NUDIX family)